MTNTNDKHIIGNQRSGRIGDVRESQVFDEIMKWDPAQALKKTVTSSVGVDPIINPVNFGVARFLGGIWGKKTHCAVTLVHGSSGPIFSLKNNYVDSLGLVNSSNPYYVVAVNEFLAPFGIRTATQADLDKIYRQGLLPLDGHRIDTSLVWRSNDDPNSYLAQDIYAQFRNKGVIFKEGTAYVIPLSGLKLKVDKDSVDGWSFALREKFHYFEAPILNEQSFQYFSDGDVDESTGLPLRVGYLGVRVLHTGNRNKIPVNARNSGLSRLGLCGNVSIDSSEHKLALSVNNSRVVCVAENEDVFIGAEKQLEKLYCY